MTQKQILIAETLEEMGDTETMNIFNFRVTREEDVYVVDGQRMCFMQAYDHITSVSE
jgi:hypothetical protein